MDKYEPSQATLDIAKWLILGAEAESGFCLGVVCALAWSQRKEPSERVMRAASMMSSVGDAVELCRLHGISRGRA